MTGPNFIPGASECFQHVWSGLARPQTEHLCQSLACLLRLGEVTPVEWPLMPRYSAECLGKLELKYGAGEVPAKKGSMSHLKGSSIQTTEVWNPMNKFLLIVPHHGVVLVNVKNGGRVEVLICPLYRWHNPNKLLLELPVFLVPFTIGIVTPV